MDSSLYSPGDWKAVDRPYNGKPMSEIHYSEDGECVAELIHNHNDAVLMAESKNLLQIAEMFYDFMKTTDHFSSTSLPFEITQKVLRRLGSR